MSTRSFIAIKEKDRFRGIYCHWDGYPEHNGKILNEHYLNPEKVSALIDGGDLSILAPEIGDGDSHKSFDDPTDGICLYYGRDRGEDNAAFKVLQTGIDVRKAARRCGAEFCYLFDNGTWLYCSIPFNPAYMMHEVEFKPLLIGLQE